MCTLLLDLAGDARRLVLGANRDERYRRPSAAPAVLHEAPRVVGGRDLEAGGTWLALRLEAPWRLVAVLNRDLPADFRAPADERRRSRGHLCLDAARAATLEEAEALAHDVADLSPFNLLLVEAGAARLVQYAGDAVRERDVPPGVHALAHRELDDPDPRTHLGRERFEAALAPLSGRYDAHAAFPALIAALRRHDEPGAPCRHGDEGGTVSSSLLALDLAGAEPPLWLYAAGPPCRTPFVSVAPRPCPHGSTRSVSKVIAP
jgi:uncharacterized protein with NRDE domain